ncbi:hypothetical protein IRP63_05470 [Clostridium botulinum]|uniref:Uncharacterized protein n=1 Tax=Clostridium botulinum C/D str. DC5 TaxID=1443128 RepID=A0A0A0IK14_CLOBO|nr:hypothetical protein [Clostridium botulinum]KGN00959.1 hypothetical protein Z955_02320 [Clostridium botulinum C/D str. DC5]KOC49325.1 hypothetical protein ADU89_15270 [Clostridium botulinum]KOC51573.1 hypothetical protein ADU90_15185 [Clostridium botulinum]MCD3235492.1 hypothetical protein [Clostridium botulinum D/C]MCD3241442.1 hypothetical protein [Clostridium botulinum D/C]
MKRRIIYKLNKATKQTDILCVQVAEELEDVELKMIDLDYETDKDKFDRSKKILIKDGKIVFELYDVNEDILKEKEKTEKELLKAQNEIVNLKYNSLLNKNI